MRSALRWQQFDLLGADLRLAQFCAAPEAQIWFERLYAEIPWEQHHLQLFGRDVVAPRLCCWIGDADAAYRYSGTRFAPHAWPPAVAELRDSLFEHCGDRYNSVLANLYRDGRDSMAWHSDDERELGAEPVIASLSFGGLRRFRIRHKHNPDLRLDLDLGAGSLLRMAGSTQRLYQHDVPKATAAVAPRINLTFRYILPSDA